MPTAPTIDGPGVRLRALRASDRDERAALGRDREFVLMNGGDPERAAPFDAAEVERWYRSFPGAVRWGIEVAGRLVGEVRLDAIDGRARRARFAIGIFDPGHRGHGIGTVATTLVLDYAFRGLGLERVHLRVLEANARAIRCYERCGFRQDGVDAAGSFVDGRWRNDVLMSADAGGLSAALRRRAGPAAGPGGGSVRSG